MTKRQVRCLECNHVWGTKATKPRCSECGSRNVEEVQNTTVPPRVSHDEVDPAKIFSAFDDGKDPIEVVKLGLADPTTALGLWNDYDKMLEKRLKIQGRPTLEERMEDVEKNLKFLKKNLIELQNASTFHGFEKKEDCAYYRDSYCHMWSFKKDFEYGFAIKTKEVNGKKIADPSVIFCALCHEYVRSKSD